MNRIKKLLETKRKNILSIYFTAGFPRINDTLTTIEELETQGIDMVEIGIPFSDPMADGVVIQQSSTIALENGMTIKLLFEQLANIRKNVKMPLVMMGYLNPIMQYGVEAFCEKCAEVGIDGVIIPDLPFNDYLKSYKAIGEKYNIKFIMLITPETSEERVRLIDEHTDGFIYMVSTAATTGAQDSFSGSTLEYFKRINNMGLKNPRLIGFGISTAASLKSAQNNSAGAIIGSAFVNLLSVSATPKDAISVLLKKIY